MSSNIIIPEASAKIMDLALEVYNKMLSNAKHLNKPICTVCEDNKAKGILLKDHFHASDIGQCHLATQLNILHPKQKAEDPINLVFLRDGHLNENVMIELLNSSYVTGYHDQEVVYRESIKVTETITEEIVVVNHPDLLIYYNKNITIVIEFKAVKDWYFKEIASKGLTSLKYFGQCQSYMHALDLKLALLFIKNRHSSQILAPFVIQYDKNYMNKRLQYLAAIQYLNNEGKGQLVPKEYNDKNTDECKFCAHKDFCWSKK